MYEEGKIKVLLVKPMEKAKVVEITDSLESMQQIVGGWIEEYMPFEDDVALICNDEGKMMGLPLNRAIIGEDGKVQDIIAGTFFICHAPIDSEKFLSLPNDLLKKYEAKFKQPQEFFRTGEGIVPVIARENREDFEG